MVGYKLQEKMVQFLKNDNLMTEIWSDWLFNLNWVGLQSCKTLTKVRNLIESAFPGKTMWQKTTHRDNDIPFVLKLSTAFFKNE